MKVINFFTKSTFVIVSSSLLVSACSTKDKNTNDDPTNPQITSQPYQKSGQIVSNANNGFDGTTLICEGAITPKFENNQEDKKAPFTLHGEYKSKIVNFSSIDILWPADEENNDDDEDDFLKPYKLNTNGIKELCAIHMWIIESDETPIKSLTYKIDSCKDASGTKYEITDSKPVSGMTLWCNK